MILTRHDSLWSIIDYSIDIALIENKFIAIEVLHPLHLLPGDGDIIELEAVYEPLLHPPEHLGLPQHAGRRHGDVLEEDPVQVPGLPLALGGVRPGLGT